jgi:hypothetical protein
LTPEHRHELVLANVRAKKIRRAAGVAAFNGWATGSLAALSAPFALSGMANVCVTVGLSVIAYNEFRGRKRLLQFDPEAPVLLGWNQIGLMMLILVYCLWMLFTTFSGAGAFATEIAANPELAGAIGSMKEFDQLYKDLAVAIYGAVIGISVAFQGLNALYYFTRRKHVIAYVRETPKWVLNLQQVMTPG